jgi:plasmid stabilization system protein ParE
MPHRVEVSDRASGDIRGIYQYIAQHGPANPDSWMDGLEKVLELLEVFPERCGLAPESRHATVEVRQTFYTGFRILFTLRDDVVIVLHVRHGARRFMTRKEARGLG